VLADPSGPVTKASGPLGDAEEPIKRHPEHEARLGTVRHSFGTCSGTNRVCNGRDSGFALARPVRVESRRGRTPLARLGGGAALGSRQ
jgi:hypothetical protein